MMDCIFRNGFVVDGSAKKGFFADVAVKDGIIRSVGPRLRETGRQEYDLDGLVIAPGFIDTHSHSDVMALVDRALMPKLMQGVTTDLLGQDGIGPAPLPDEPDCIRSWQGYLAGLDGNPGIDWPWRSLAEYADALDVAPTGVNLALLLPQGNVRMRVLGLENRKATEAELARMEEESERGMREGAWGVSLGMVYMPCIFADHEEWIRIFRRVARHNGFFVVHMRNSSSLLLESLQELYDLADQSGIDLHVSHFKATGKANWPKMEAALRLLDERKASGGRVSFDIYPYEAGSTMFSVILPPWTLEGGMDATLQRLRDPAIREAVLREWKSPPASRMDQPGWDNHVYTNGWDAIRISSARSQNPELIGRSMTEIAQQRGQGPEETAFSLMEEEGGDLGLIVFSMSEDCVAMGIRHPLGMICTDGLLGGKPHPRVYGSFPRVLARYVRERGDLSLEAAIHKMTGMPAARIGLPDRGLIRPGFKADIVVFDPHTVRDTATYADPCRFPEGMVHVMVNGAHSVKNGVFTGELGGRVLRRGLAAQQEADRLRRKHAHG